MTVSCEALVCELADLVVMGSGRTAHGMARVEFSATLLLIYQFQTQHQSTLPTQQLKESAANQYANHNLHIVFSVELVHLYL